MTTKRRARPIYGSDNPDVMTMDDIRHLLGFRSLDSVYKFLATHPDFPPGRRPLQERGRSHRRWHGPSVRAWFERYWGTPPREEQSA